MTGPIPEAYVAGHLRGGPHDGETIWMPWARIEVPMTRWEGETMITSVYKLAAPWRGQADAQYEYVQPVVEVERREAA